MKPFAIDVASSVLDDLQSRLLRTRWPGEVENAYWDYGTSEAYLRNFVSYWMTSYDWKHQEMLLNQFPQYIARVGNIDIHFLYVRGKGPNPLPLIITHGWPGSFFEMNKIVGPLTDPGGYGADPADAFDVVVPSLPGFGFSARPVRSGPAHVDRLWRRLMTEMLGYRRFVAHGGDIGARVTSALGRFHADVVTAIHIGSVDLEWPEPLPGEEEMSDAERDYLGRVRRWEKEEGAYAEIQATRPQTLSYGLNDSPVGLAAWIVEKFRAWSDCAGDIESRFTKDELLTNIMIYWISQSIGSSVRRYFEQRHDPSPNPLRPGERIETPAGIAMFPGEKDLIVPREWAERCYHITRWTEMERGGHFPALEEPVLLVEELRNFFRDYR